MQRCSDQSVRVTTFTRLHRAFLSYVWAAPSHLCDANLYAPNPPRTPHSPDPLSHQTNILSACAPVQLSAADRQEFDRGMCSLGLITAGRFNSVLVGGFGFSKSFFILFQLLVIGKGKTSQCFLCICISFFLRN